MKLKLGASELILVISVLTVVIIKSTISPVLFILLLLCYFGRNKMSEKLFGVASLLLVSLSVSHILLYFLLFAFPSFLLVSSLNYKKLTWLETFIFSFTLAGLWLIPLQFLTYIGIGGGNVTAIFFIVVVPLVISFLNRETLIKRVRKTKNDLNLKSILPYLLVLFLVVVLIWGPFMNDLAIPRTASSGYFAQMRVIGDRFAQDGKLPMWDAEQNLGYPIFAFDPPGYHYTVGIIGSLTPQTSLVTDYNYSFLLFMILGAFSFFALSKRLYDSNVVALIPGILFMSNPFLSTLGVFTGYTKTLTAFAFVPLILSILMVADKNSKYYLPAAVAASFVFIIHPIVGAQTLILGALAFLIKRVMQKRLFSKKEFMDILFAGIFLLVITSFSLLPFVILDYQGYTSPTAVYPGAPSIGLAIERLLGEPEKTLDFNVGGLFLALGLIGAVGIGVSRKDIKDFALPLAFLVIFLLYFIAITKPIGSVMDYAKYKLFYIMIVALLAPGIYYFAKDVKIRLVAVILLLVFAGFYGGITHWRNSDWVSETYQNGEIYKAPMDALKAQPYGRVITYGPYGTVVDQNIPHFTEKPSVGHAHQVAQHNDIFFIKVYDEGKRMIPEKRSGEYIYNILRQSYTRYYFFDVCNQGGYNSIQKLQDKATSIIYQDQCIYILAADAGGYAESVKISKIEIDEDSLYEIQDAWKVVGFKDVFDEYEYVIDGAEDVQNIGIPVPLEFSRPGPEQIFVHNPPEGWILVKEQYFPRWFAYQNSKPVETRMSNLGFILVKSSGTGDIEIIHKQLWYDTVFAGLGVLFLFLFIFREKLNLYKGDND